MKYRLEYTGVRVRDLEKSLAFYSGILGMKESRRGRAQHGGVYVYLKSPGSPQVLELNWYPEGNPFATPYSPGEGLDHLAFGVEDVGKAYEELKAKGVRVAVKPSQAKAMATEVYVEDPDGNWIEIMGPGFQA